MCGPVTSQQGETHYGVVVYVCSSGTETRPGRLWVKIRANKWRKTKMQLKKKMVKPCRKSQPRERQTDKQRIDIVRVPPQKEFHTGMALTSLEYYETVCYFSVLSCFYGATEFQQKKRQLREILRNCDKSNWATQMPATTKQVFVVLSSLVSIFERKKIT